MLDDVGGGGVRKKSVRHSAAERAAIVAESYELGATVAVVARRHGIVASQLSTWRTAAKRKTNPVDDPAFADLTVMPGAFQTAFDGVEIALGAVTVRLPKSTTPKRIADIAQRLAGG